MSGKVLSSNALRRPARQRLRRSARVSVRQSRRGKTKALRGRAVTGLLVDLKSTCRECFTGSIFRMLRGYQPTIRLAVSDCRICDGSRFASARTLTGPSAFTRWRHLRLPWLRNEAKPLGTVRRGHDLAPSVRCSSIFEARHRLSAASRRRPE